jgi:hypothetical protein
VERNRCADNLRRNLTFGVDKNPKKEIQNPKQIQNRKSQIMMSPQVVVASPTAVYAETVNLGVRLSAQGKPVGKLTQLTLQGATVNSAGVWQNCGKPMPAAPFTFSFDSAGNVTGLPPDLASLAPAIAAAWQAVEAVVDGINKIRKLV